MCNQSLNNDWVIEVEFRKFSF